MNERKIEAIETYHNIHKSAFGFKNRGVDFESLSAEEIEAMTAAIEPEPFERTLWFEEIPEEILNPKSGEGWSLITA